jgi:hypothetical protein
MAQHGTVTLTGTVASENEKQLVAALVQNTSGVTNVDNQLQVSLTPTSQRPNESSRIYSNSTRQVTGTIPAAQIPAQPFSSSIGDSTNSTDVTLAASAAAQVPLSSATQAGLSTNVENQQTAPQQAGNATRLYSTNSNQNLAPTSQRPNDANRIYATPPNGSPDSGTTEPASSSIDVKVQGNSEADRAIAQNLLADIRADESIAALVSAVKIDIENGKATLHGTVKTEQDKQLIEAAVQKAVGVTSIEDQLQVGSSIKTDRSE